MLFYTGTTLAGAMYIVGAVEIALVSGHLFPPRMGIYFITILDNMVYL